MHKLSINGEIVHKAKFLPSLAGTYYGVLHLRKKSFWMPRGFRHALALG